MTLLFDYNFLFLLADEEFMVCPTTFKRFQKLGKPLFTDLDHKGVHSTKPLSPI